MKAQARQVVVAVAGVVLRALARVRIAMVLRSATVPRQRLLRAVRRTLQDDFAPEERAWIERIEAMRGRLLASADPVTVVDYGAGGPGDTRTAEEMRRGRATQARVGDICRRASKPPFWARLLFALVREFRPRTAVELGTCLGVSAAYQGAAMQLNGNGGRLFTLEGADNLAALAVGNVAGLQLDNIEVVAGRFDLTLDRVLRTAGTLDYAFIDGHHDEHATVAYFHQLLPFLSPGALLVFDDITWSPGMVRAWEKVAADPRVRAAVSLRAVGLCVLGDESVPASHDRYFLP